LSIEIIALNCLGFQKIAILHAFLRQTDGRKDGQVRRVGSLLRAAAY